MAATNFIHGTQYVAVKIKDLVNEDAPTFDLGTLLVVHDTCEGGYRCQSREYDIDPWLYFYEKEIKILGEL